MQGGDAREHCGLREWSREIKGAGKGKQLEGQRC